MAEFFLFSWFFLEVSSFSFPVLFFNHPFTWKYRNISTHSKSVIHHKKNKEKKKRQQLEFIEICQFLKTLNFEWTNSELSFWKVMPFIHFA